MNADKRRQRDIERDEQWLRGIATPGPSADVLDRVKMTVHQACAGDERIPGTDEAIAAAKIAVRRELGSTRVEASPLLSFPRWLSAAAVAAMVGFALIGSWRGVVVGGAEDLEIQRLADVLDRDADDIDVTLAALAMDIADLEEDYLGTADTLWGESSLDGLGDALDDLLSEQSVLRETS